MSRVLRNTLLIVFIAAPSLHHSLVSALEFTLEPHNTDRPAPVEALVFNAQRNSTDPQFVDIILRDTRRQNSTTVLPRHDLSVRPHAGFPIPEFTPAGTGYVVQMADSTSKRVLAQSPRFEIFPAGTPPSSTYAVKADTSTVTVPTSTSSPSTTATPSPGPPVAAIAGGVVGGVALLAIFGTLIWCIRRESKPLTLKEIEKKKRVPATEIISPFIVTEPTPPVKPTPGADRGTGAAGVGYSNEAAASSSTGLVTGANAEGRAYPSARNEKTRIANAMNNNAGTSFDYFTPARVERLPTELTANSTIGEGSDIGHSPSTSRSGSMFASTTSRSGSTSKGKHRRKKTAEAHELVATNLGARSTDEERLRLEREIAALERAINAGGSASAPGPASSSGRWARPNTENDEKIARLEALKEELRALEGRPQAAILAPQITIPNEPPPDYFSTSAGR